MPSLQVLSSSAGSASSASSYWEEELASKLAAKLLLLEGAQVARINFQYTLFNIYFALLTP